jgi:hypothetical protein
VKKFIYLISLAGIMMIMVSACGTVGYVSTVPTHSERYRPAQPSTYHVWIDGDWEYNRTTHSYYEQPGYWEQPSQNTIYIAGYWQTSPQGHYWVKGKHQKHNNGNGNGNYNN